MGKSLHTFGWHKLLARFGYKREGMVLIYLLLMADEGGWVDYSVYTMARLLCLHRQTLNRIIQRLCQKGYAVWDGDEGKRLRVGFHVEAATEQADQVISQDGMTAVKMDSEDSGKPGVTSGVTTFVTDDVTVFDAQNDVIKRCVSRKYKNKEFLGVTGAVTGVVTSAVTQKETKENKEEIPPAPPKEEKKQKKEKTPTITRACEKKFKPSKNTPLLDLFFEPESTALELDFPDAENKPMTVEPESSGVVAESPAVVPGLSAADSEISALEPESSVVVPIFSAVGPDTSAVKPESPTAEPISYVAEPDSSAADSDSSVAEPAGERKPKKGRAKPDELLEKRRQRFLDSLSSYTGRYGDEMINDFVDYWTETNRSNTLMRFELERTWNTSKRLARWAKKAQIFNYKNNNYDKFHQPTSADYIRDAQLEAIRATEQFIREAEKRRGGVPPHLPF